MFSNLYIVRIFKEFNKGKNQNQIIWLKSKLTTGPDFVENKLLQTSVATVL